MATLVIASSHILINHQMVCGFGFGGFWILRSVDQGSVWKFVRKFYDMLLQQKVQAVWDIIELSGADSEQKNGSRDQESSVVEKLHRSKKESLSTKTAQFSTLDTANALGYLGTWNHPSRQHGHPESLLPPFPSFSWMSVARLTGKDSQCQKRCFQCLAHNPGYLTLAKLKPTNLTPQISSRSIKNPSKICPKISLLQKSHARQPFLLRFSGDLQRSSNCFSQEAVCSLLPLSP